MAMVIFDESLVSSPLVSVAIITYNHKRFLHQCIEHVLSQITDFDIEIVIADDFSVDGTTEICKEYQKMYPQKIKLILQDKNVGLINNYCSLLHACRGEYIAQISGDDYWCDDKKLQKQVEALQVNRDCDLCYTNFYICGIDGNHSNCGKLEDGHFGISFERHLLNAGYLDPASWMFRRTVISYMDMQSWFPDESFALALDVLAHSRFCYLNEVMAIYRSHKGSASSPIEAKGLLRFRKGVFDMQIYYANKYQCSLEMKEKIRVRGYLYILPFAVLAEDDEFIKEAQAYLGSKDYNIDQIVRILKEGQSARNSYAYRVGKRLVSPFSWLKRKCISRKNK